MQYLNQRFLSLSPLLIPLQISISFPLFFLPQLPSNLRSIPHSRSDPKIELSIEPTELISDKYHHRKLNWTIILPAIPRSPSKLIPDRLRIVRIVTSGIGAVPIPRDLRNWSTIGQRHIRLWQSSHKHHRIVAAKQLFTQLGIIVAIHCCCKQQAINRGNNIQPRQQI